MLPSMVEHLLIVFLYRIAYEVNSLSLRYDQHFERKMYRSICALVCLITVRRPSHPNLTDDDGPSSLTVRPLAL